SVSFSFLSEGGVSFSSLSEGACLSVLSLKGACLSVSNSVSQTFPGNQTASFKVFFPLLDQLLLSVTLGVVFLQLQLCVSTSSWSDGFSLDTVGSYGCVRCPANTMDYLVGVSIQMSSFNLTKMVTMSPFFTLVNKSSYELEVGEVQTEEGSVNGKWHYISSTECLPLWPELITGNLCVRVVGSDSKSKSFFFNKQDNGTLLGMDQYGGVIVDVNISDNSTVISFTDYYDGAAPALIVNHTPWVVITYRQRLD
ncbi:unnamed protein product, partial [Oncorhynchus mykiss]